MVDMEFEEGEIREIVPGMRQSKGCIRRIFIGKNSIPSEAICTAGMNIPLMTRVEALNGQLVRGEIVGVPKFTLNQISTDAMELIVNLVKPGEITNFEYIEYLGSDQGKNDIKYQLEALKLLGKMVLTNINQFTGEQLDNRFIDRSLVRQIINKVKYGSEGKRLPNPYMKFSQKDIDKVYELLVINICAPYKYTLKYNDVKKDTSKLFYKVMGRNIFDYFKKPKDLNIPFNNNSISNENKTIMVELTSEEVEYITKIIRPFLQFSTVSILVARILGKMENQQIKQMLKY